MKKSILNTILAASAVILAAPTSRAEALNILSLGAKADGSADISAIVNAATEKGAIYLPAGIYRVSHPLRLKNPLRGDGYARTPEMRPSHTWLVCDFEAAKGGSGVIEFDGSVQMTVENLNIRCKGQADGIRIAKCRQSTATYIDRVGIFNVASFGLYVEGGGSRPIFAGDMTIFGEIGGGARSVGIRLKGACDCRLSNIEVMGTAIGLEALNGHTYADNLHLWTGCMGKRMRSGWWKETRGLVLGDRANFAGSNIYPDTSYYAIDFAGRGAICEISNIMYWEDGSVASDPARDGAFFHQNAKEPGRLIVHGGLVGVTGSDKRPGAMRDVYSPGQTMEGVMMKCHYAIRPENISKLCLGGDLPDYTVEYATNAFCKVADILTPARSGSCEAKVVRDDGAAWRVGVVKKPDGQLDVRAKAVNALAGETEIRLVAERDHVKVFLLPPASSARWTARFITSHMNDFCRPVDHGSLRDGAGLVRYRETLPR